MRPQTSGALAPISACLPLHCSFCRFCRPTVHCNHCRSAAGHRSTLSQAAQGERNPRAALGLHEQPSRLGAHLEHFGEHADTRSVTRAAAEVAGACSAPPQPLSLQTYTWRAHMQLACAWRGRARQLLLLAPAAAGRHPPGLAASAGAGRRCLHQHARLRQLRQPTPLVRGGPGG